MLSFAYMAYSASYLVAAVYLIVWAPPISAILVMFGILNLAESVGLWLGRQWGRKVGLAVAALGVVSCVATAAFVPFANWEGLGLVTLITGLGFGPLTALIFFVPITFGSASFAAAIFLAVALLGAAINLAALWYLRGQTSKGYLLK